VSEKPDWIKQYICVLEDFETRFGEWVVGLHSEYLEETPVWPRRERSERERELREMAPRAERAMDASGVGRIKISWPPYMQRSDAMVGDLLGVMFYNGPSGFESDDGLDVQRGILERVPSQIAGLRMKLEEAEEAPMPETAPQQPRGRNPNPPSKEEGWIRKRATEIAVGVIIVVLGALAVGAIAHWTSLL
jgi:hypothetical protein